MYNAKMSAVMICTTKGDKELCFPDFYLTGQNKIPGSLHFRSHDDDDDT